MRFFLAITRITIILAQNKPLLVVLDDLHWADQSSLDLFSYLVFSLADMCRQESIPLFFLGTHRPVEPEGRLARVIARFQREQICCLLELPGLNESEVYELLQDLGTPRPSHQLVTTINQATQGNPLFIREVFRHLVQQGALEERAGYTVAVPHSSACCFPAHLTAAIATRLDALSPDCHTLLTVASFFGVHISFPLLSAVGDMPEEESLDLLEEGLT